MNTLIVLLILLYIIHLSLAFRRISPPRIQYESTKSLDHDNCRYYKLYSTTDNENIQSTPIETLKSKLRGTNVYFIGMMGSGKTTVAKEFADLIDYRCLDTDEIAEFMIETTIPEFFNQGKEAEFRQVEYQILMEMCQYTRLVLATGGGIVEKMENWGVLRHGLVIFLDISPEDIFNRLTKNPDEIQKRPMLQGSDPLERLKELSSKRNEKYLQADVRIEIKSDQSPQDVALNTVYGILDFIETNPPLWQTWKKKREAVAIETAAMMNPKATAEAGVGFGENKGSVQYVSLQDIESGKVKLPNGTGSQPVIDSSNDQLQRPPSKGFKRDIIDGN